MTLTHETEPPERSAAKARASANTFTKPKKENRMTRDKLNQSLIDASAQGDAEGVKSLLKAGADVHKDDDYAVRLASEDGRVEVVRLLIAAGADVHAGGDYALHAASLNGHAEEVQMLLDAGANIHARDSSALRYAVESGHIEVIKILIDWKGANK